MNHFTQCAVLILLALVLQATKARIFDELHPNDVCYDEAAGTYGTCDTTRFPVCDSTSQLICYNRRPFRDQFYTDNRQPKYFIDYKSVYCYPTTFQGCSSCSPGRFCKSETRCILDEETYNCAEWY